MIKTTKKARGGFFFAVMALAMLSLVLMTVQIWVKTFEQSDYRASQRFKGEAVRSILSSISDKTLADFAHASAFYATYRLADYTSKNGQELGRVQGSDEDKNKDTGNVETAAIWLMVNGSTPPNWAPGIQYSDEEKNAYTLGGLQNRINAAVNAMGFDIEFSEAKQFRYYQTDPWTVGVSFDLEMNITDKELTMRQSMDRRAESSFPISGFLDPMISRNDMERRGVDRGAASEKQIFKLEEYDEPADVKPAMVKSDGVEGNGWFFGPITEDPPEEIMLKSTDAAGATMDNLKQYVLVSPYNDSLYGFAELYGAVIVTTAPGTKTTIENGCTVTTQTDCLNCMRKKEGPNCADRSVWETFEDNNPVNVPVIVVTGWNTNDVTTVTRADADGNDIDEQFVLIDNENENVDEKMAGGYHRVWDITKLRDMAICGFYVQGKGPSFFQRMLEGAERIPNSEFGIESFVVGQWAGGKDNKAADPYSRLDWEFYSDEQGTKIKGMMGCKSKEMCLASGAADIGLGHFRLSNDAISRYDVGLVSCGATPSAPCD